MPLGTSLANPKPLLRISIAFAHGACSGVLMIRISAAVRAASNAVVNFGSRSLSRVRNWMRCPAPSTSTGRLRVVGSPERRCGDCVDNRSDGVPPRQLRR